MRRHRVLTVFWHSVESDSIRPDYLDGSNPTASLFREQIRFLVDHYTPISMSEFLDLVSGRRGTRPLPRPPVLLGFDDGFKNVIVNALPILEEAQIPATFFVVGEALTRSGFVPWFVELTHLVRKARRTTVTWGSGIVDLADPRACSTFKRRFEVVFRACRSQSDRERLLSEISNAVAVPRPQASELDDDLRFVAKEDLAKLGVGSLLTIGSHAMTHRHLAALSREEQRAEAEMSDAILREHCPRYCPVIAYPGGSFNADTLAVVRTTYRAGFAVLLGSSYRNPYAYPRMGLGHQTAEELRYLLSDRRLRYLLPVKRFLHSTGLRSMD